MITLGGIATLRELNESFRIGKSSLMRTFRSFSRFDRRAFLSRALYVGSAAALPSWPGMAQESKGPRSVAAILTWYIKGSHADVLVGKILEGWNQDIKNMPRPLNPVPLNPVSPFCPVSHVAARIRFHSVFLGIIQFILCNLK